MNEVTRPAVDTLRAMRKGKTMDELAVALQEATAAVKLIGKAAKVTLTIEIKPYVQAGTVLIDQPVVIEGDVSTKLPKPKKEGTLFFVDKNCNPTQEQPREERQPGLSLTVGGAHAS